MSITRLLAVLLALLSSLPAARGQDTEATREQIFDGLVAPLALVPDMLLTPVLEATSNVDALVAMAEAVAQGSPGAELPAAPTGSLGALSKVTEVLELMAANTEWMGHMNLALTHHRREVMEALQRVRKGAIAAGTLTNDGVIAWTESDGRISVGLADEGVLHVPRYEASLVLVPLEPGDPPFIEYGPAISFPGYRTVAAGLRAADAVASLSHLPGPGASAGGGDRPAASPRYSPRRPFVRGLLLYHTRRDRGQPVKRITRLMAWNTTFIP